MKQNQIANYLKLGILLFGISLIVASCQKDDFTNQSNESSKTESDFKITTLRKDKILEKKSLLTKLEKIETKLKVQSKATSINGREVYSEENGFTVNTDYCKEIFDGIKYTYTFPVYRDEDNGFLENLWLIEEADSTYTAYLVQYEFTSEDITAINFRQQINVENKITYIELNADELVGDIFGKYFFNGNCYDDSWVYQSGSNCTAGDNHSYSAGAYNADSNPNGCHAWGTSEMATNGGYSLITTLVPCDGTGGNPSDPSNGGNPPDYNPTNPNSNPNHGGGNQGGSTTVVTCKRNCVPDTEPMDGQGNNNPDQKNCEELQKLLDTPTYPIPAPKKSPKNAIIELQGELGEWNEQGFTLSHNSSLNNFANPISNLNNSEIAYPMNINVYGAMHTHPDNSHSFIEHPIDPIFSHQDIYNLHQFYDTYNNPNAETDTSLFVHILVTSTGTYAIKINDLTKFQEIASIYSDRKEKRKFIRKSNRKYKDFYSASTNTIDDDNPKEWQKAFLEFITEDYDLGISFYSLNPALETWEKLEIDESEDDDIKETPCN